MTGNFEILQDQILPIVIQEKSKYSDVSTIFLQTLFEQFDFQAALGLAKDLGKAANEDLLLKAFANEIQSQAVILIFQVKARIYRSVNIKELAGEVNSLGHIKNEEEARIRLEESLKKEGFHLEPLEGTTPESKHFYKVLGQTKDAKVKIVSKTIELVKRTNDLFNHYQSQVKYLNDSLKQ
jgi:hypothetical protein